MVIGFVKFKFAVKNFCLLLYVRLSIVSHTLSNLLTVLLVNANNVVRPKISVKDVIAGHILPPKCFRRSIINPLISFLTQRLMIVRIDRIIFCLSFLFLFLLSVN